MSKRSRTTPVSGSCRASLTQALTALVWLGVATPALADVPPAPDSPAAETSAQDAPARSGETTDPTNWGPIIAACLGVLAGGWIARKQIQGWKKRG